MSEGSSQSGPVLHPNLAAMAASYDLVIAEMEARRLTPAAARARIGALEARDDQGVRWSIDPDTGQFLRKTAFGDVEFDTPPSSGVMTATGFTYSSTSRDDDPRLRMNVFAAGAPSVPLGDVPVNQSNPSGGRTAATYRAVLVAAAVIAVLIVVLLVITTVTSP